MQWNGTNTQIDKYTNTQTHSVKPMQWNGTNTQIHKYTNTQPMQWNGTNTLHKRIQQKFNQRNEMKWDKCKLEM